MNALLLISILLLIGCAPMPKAEPMVEMQSFAQPALVLPPPALDPPPGITIPITNAFNGLECDYFTANDIEGPWVYRTDDLRFTTNDDGTTSGYFANTPPGAMREFYWIVPVGFPLPANIVTNFNHQ